MAIHLAILILHLLFILSALKAELKFKQKHAYFNDGFALQKTLNFVFYLIKVDSNITKIYVKDLR